MGLLTDAEANKVTDAVYDTIGYSESIRRILFSSVNNRFKALLNTDSNEFLQLELDIINLNRTSRLADGTIPFVSWLEKTARLLKPYADASNVIQHALGHIMGKYAAVQPDNVNPPSVEKIVQIQLEKTVHENDMVSYSFLEAGSEAGKSVARIKVPRYEAGIARVQNTEAVIFLGTGWLLTKDLIITNHHVINARESNEPSASNSDFGLQALNTIIEFDYNSDSRSGINQGVATLEGSDKALDFAILRLTPITNRKPLSLRPEKMILSTGQTPAVNIIQHPFGYAKKVALRNNHIYDAQYPRVRYFTDTEGGSSGSPVFNDSWEVIALHRASTLVDNVVYMGKSTAWVNEGTQLSAIMDYLNANFPVLAAEITGT